MHGCRPPAPRHTDVGGAGQLSSRGSPTPGAGKDLGYSEGGEAPWSIARSDAPSHGVVRPEMSRRSLMEMHAPSARSFGTLSAPLSRSRRAASHSASVSKLR